MRGEEADGGRASGEEFDGGHASGEEEGEAVFRRGGRGGRGCRSSGEEAGEGGGAGRQARRMASPGFRQEGEEDGITGAGLQARRQRSYGIECLPEEVDYTNAINDHEEADNIGENNEYADNEVPEPRAGMCFDTIDEAFKYYKIYGKQLGFPVIKSSSKKGDDGSKQYQTMSCGRGGKFTSTSSNSLKPHPSMKIDCKALIRIGKCFDGKWKIKSTVLQHNHGLSPEKSRYFPVNRGLSVSMKRRLELNDVANIGLNKSYNSIVVEACGHENVSFLEKDARNHIEKARRLRLNEGDATAVQTYFTDMQAKNPNFFYAIDLNEKGRLRNLFWADARSRAAYLEFGDVVTFDTTYLTNKYEMPFAPFVGVNHHEQSILLGCGLISSEDTETFVWLFKSWLSCMSDNAPGGIITDQDRAMRNAIEIVFPNTRHRLCY